MFWAKETRVDSIADRISRDMTFSNRNHLKFLDDSQVSDETKYKDMLWKLRPLIDRIKQGCLKLPRSTNVAVDEDMIPFTGLCGIKQFVRRKPNPEGLKIFVLADPTGLVLDFGVNQGRNLFPHISLNISCAGKLGIEWSAIIRLSESLPAGSYIFLIGISQPFTFYINFQNITC